ncbi:hypothetical protein RCL1_006638 [Eukaryota sp. TZLM3-RCL]
MSCPHTNLVTLPTSETLIFKDECVYCTDSDGVFVCLHCYLGFCYEHAVLHLQKHNHHIFANVIKTPIPSTVTEESLREQFAHGTILLEDDQYDVQVTPYCLTCDLIELSSATPPLSQIVSIVMSSASAQQKQTSLLMQEGLPKPCPHLRLPSKNDSLIKFDGHKCRDCELSSNLWLCLSCLDLNCGRSQAFIEGNGHALNHALTRQHHVAVKFGTLSRKSNGILTGEGYCYACDDTVEIPDLSSLIEDFDLDLSSIGVEKSTSEISASVNIDFDVTEFEGDMSSINDSVELTSRDQSFLIGIKNGGNNCYINSLLQTLKFLPNFSNLTTNHFITCPRNPVDCLECQTIRIMIGLQKSPSFDKFPLIPSNCPTPFLFKSIVAGNNSQWKSLAQQDVSEYLSFLIERFQNFESNFCREISSSLKFSVRSSIHCTTCDHVAISLEDFSGPIILYLPTDVYSTAPEEGAQSKLIDGPKIKMIDLIKSWADETINFDCSTCQCKREGLRSRRFLTFPSLIAFSILRFTVRDGKEIKLNVAVDYNHVDEFLTGLRAVPINNPIMSSATTFDCDHVALSQLISLGISENHAKNALKISNNNLESAAEWAFTHDEILDQNIENSDLFAQNSQLISELQMMGFSENSIKASIISLGKSKNSDRCIDWILNHQESEIDQILADFSKNQKEVDYESIKMIDCEPVKFKFLSTITHKGNSPHCGHYICHVSAQSIKKSHQNDCFILFNDTKVGISMNPPLEHGFVFTFIRE